MVQKLVQFPEKEARITDAGYDTLTFREQEVMDLLAQGISVKDIAEKLFISPKTVENHRSSIMRKLDLHSNRRGSVERINLPSKTYLISFSPKRVGEIPTFRGLYHQNEPLTL